MEILLGSKRGVFVSTNMAQLGFGLVVRYELLSVSLATGFSPGCTIHMFSLKQI